MSTDAAIGSYMPRYRWGSISPRPPKVETGPGYEFYRLIPLEVMEIKTMLGIADYSNAAVEAAIGRFWDCVELLQREHVDRIVLGGVPVSARLGRARVRELLDAAEQKTGIGFDAPLEAVIACMRHLGLTQLAVASRWAKDLNTAVASYLADGGIEVVASTERGQQANEAAAMTLAEGLELALEVGREAGTNNPDAQAIFVAGGATLSLHVIPALEAEFDKPAMTNLSALVFNGLVGPGVIDPPRGWGCLLAQT